MGLIFAELFKPEDQKISYIVGLTKDELGGSEFYAEHGFIGKNVPKIDFKISKKIFKKISKAIAQNLIESCHDCSDGGLAVALAECAFSGDVGIEINLSKVPIEKNLSNEKILFSESASRFVLSIKEKNKEKFENLMKGVNFANIGFVRKEKKFVVKKEGKEIINVDVDELREVWKRTLNT